MATHSSVLAWRIPGTAEPGGLPSMGSRVGHDWSGLAAEKHGRLLLGFPVFPVHVAAAQIADTWQNTCIWLLKKSFFRDYTYYLLLWLLYHINVNHSIQTWKFALWTFMSGKSRRAVFQWLNAVMVTWTPLASLAHELKGSSHGARALLSEQELISLIQWGFTGKSS